MSKVAIVNQCGHCAQQRRQEGHLAEEAEVMGDKESLGFLGPS
jgi:hypothetical protein